MEILVKARFLKRAESLSDLLLGFGVNVFRQVIHLYLLVPDLDLPQDWVFLELQNRQVCLFFYTHFSVFVVCTIYMLRVMAAITS